MENNETKISEETEMKCLTFKHLDFAPAFQFKEWKGDPKAILVITNRINGRNYKAKSMLVGAVTACVDRKKGERWCFHSSNLNLEADTVFIISIFLEGMNAGKIKFDPEKGELTNE